ncbi:MAG: hypothetical protein EOM26_03045 [Alphaproteobacteria bacterium]|nr:hypothetical protein [Alphaproteobacteria bacterium]
MRPPETRPFCYIAPVLYIWVVGVIFLAAQWLVEAIPLDTTAYRDWIVYIPPLAFLVFLFKNEVAKQAARRTLEIYFSPPFRLHFLLFSFSVGALGLGFVLAFIRYYQPASFMPLMDSVEIQSGRFAPFIASLPLSMAVGFLAIALLWLNRFFKEYRNKKAQAALIAFTVLLIGLGWICFFYFFSPGNFTFRL